MDKSNNLSIEKGQAGVIILVLVIFLVIAFAGGRHFFHNTRNDIRDTVHDAGQDLKATGRDAADNIRDTVNK